MANPKKHLLKKKTVGDRYILVTEQNRKHCIVLGRVLWRLKHYDAQNLEVTSWYDVRPRHVKGKMTLINYPKLSAPFTFCIFNEESEDEYAESFRSVLKHDIESGILYIKKDEPLMEYTHEANTR